MLCPVNAAPNVVVATHIKPLGLIARILLGKNVGCTTFFLSSAAEAFSVHAGTDAVATVH